jgi:hypothetical protein
MVQPATGFQVASVHSILELVAMLNARELMDAAGRRGDHHERIIANIPICRSSCSRERTARRL